MPDVKTWMGFHHLGFMGVCNGQRKLIMDGGAIARYYVLKGRAPIDALTTIASVAQVRHAFAHEALCQSHVEFWQLGTS